MNTYTIVINEEQRQVIAHALEKFSQLWLGQTGAEQTLAKKLVPAMERCANISGSTVDLSK